MYVYVYIYIYIYTHIYIYIYTLWMFYIFISCNNMHYIILYYITLHICTCYHVMCKMYSSILHMGIGLQFHYNFKTTLECHKTNIEFHPSGDIYPFQTKQGFSEIIVGEIVVKACLGADAA